MSARSFGTNLAGAWLPNANLRGAHLVWAQLPGAHLDGANFTDADLTRAKWPELTPAPEGWERDTHSGRLRRAVTRSLPADTH